MADSKYQKLRLKIIFSTLAFSLIPLLALGVFIYVQFSQTYTDKVVGNLRTAVENKKRAIDTLLEEKIANVRMVAQTHTYAQMSDPAYLQDVFNVVQSATKFFVDIGVINDEGEHVAYVGPHKLRGVNYKEEEWFHQVMLKGVYVSDVFTGFRNFPHFIIAVKRQEQGRSWILRLSVDQDVFNTLVQAIQVGRRGDAFLVNGQGILQTASRMGGQALSESRLPVPGYFSGDRVETQQLYDQPFIVAMTWLEKVKWLLVFTEDPSEQMSPFLSTLYNVLFITVVGMLVIIAGTVWTTRGIIAKIVDADREAARLDASLMHSSKMAALGKLAAGVAHEVNNPLTLIRESAGWIKDLLSEEDPAKIQNYEEISEALDRVDQHVERAKGVTHRMLGFGRRMEPTQDNINIHGVVDETLKFLENEALHRNIVFVRQYMTSPPLLNSDPAQLQQVFLNIIDNALDAIGQDGTVTIATSLSNGGQQFRVAISDTGHGIPPDKLSTIFDPFYTTKKVGEGTGLGLSIVYGIVEKLGGHIEAQSEVGKGSTFIITLPVEARQA